MPHDPSHPAPGFLRIAADWLVQLRESMRPRQGDDFTRAYAGHLAHRVPLLYAIVFLNNLILAYSFYSSAPALLTVWLPLISVVPIWTRAVHWLPSRVRSRPIALLRRDVRMLGMVGPLVAFLCTAWALALYEYGGGSQRSLVHYIVAITCFATILGLGQSPRAALRIAVVSLGPATYWFLTHHHPNSLAVSTVQLVIGGLLLLVAHGYHHDFVALEESRQATASRERAASELASVMSTHANRDPLTGARNRRAILAELEQQLLLNKGGPLPWLVLLDLDGFKYVNDTFGHAAGDEVLKSVCRRVGWTDWLIAFGRLGGDEFALLLPGELSPENVRRQLTCLIESISEPIEFEGYELSVAGSMGLHQAEPGQSVVECLERADAALYKAKKTPGVVVEFSDADEQAMADHQAITRVFVSSNLEEQISLVYQPIIDFDTRKIECFEAFCRWTPPGGAELPPENFIALAESTGRIRELTDVVLKRALAECPVWKKGSSLSINLSARDLVDENAADRIARLVLAADAPAEAIVLEITERSLAADIRRAADTLDALRQRGFSIALDDFGTGQSSLARVHQLPLDRIKIDRSFAQGIEVDAGRRDVAATILSLARQLGLGCTFEGIETAEQAGCARSIGVRSMQGYFFGKPAPVSQVLARLDAA